MCYCFINLFISFYYIVLPKALERQTEADTRMWQKKMAQLQRTLQEVRKENFQLKEKVSHLQEISPLVSYISIILLLLAVS